MSDEAVISRAQHYVADALYEGAPPLHVHINHDAEIEPYDPREISQPGHWVQGWVFVPAAKKTYRVRSTVRGTTQLWLDRASEWRQKGFPDRARECLRIARDWRSNRQRVALP